MTENEMPRPPYVLVFGEEPAPGAEPGTEPGTEPLLISADERGALPLFDSEEKARAFLESTGFGPGWRPAEVSGAGLMAVLETCRGEVEYVALNPPPARAGGMRIRMGSLEELIRALEQSREDDLFGLGGPNPN